MRIRVSLLRLVLLAFGVVSGLTAGFAQDGIHFRHLTVKDGLSQGTVITIFQDNQGFMWFGTQDGLNRYDGYSFRVFKHDPSDSTTVNDNFIVLIAEDTAGSLWVGTREHPELLSRFDAATESFTHWGTDSVSKKGWRISAARSEYVDPYGFRWSGTLGKGLARVDERTGQSTMFQNDPSNPRSLSENRVYSVVGDRTGVIWVGTRNGLDRFEPKTESFVHYRNDPSDPKSLSDNFVWPILEDRSGQLWVGTFRGGLNRYDRETGTFVHFRHEDTNPRSLAGDQLYALYQDRSGVIWVGLGDQGVDRFHPELGPFAHLYHDPSNAAGLVDDIILAAHVGPSGDTWIGTNAGLDRWDRKSGQFIHYRPEPSNPWSLGDASVLSLLEDREGFLWVGTSNGLDRYDRRTGRFTHFRHDPKNPRSLTENRIYALAEDRSGDIWIGTYAGGLNRYEKKTGTFHAYVHSDSIPASLGGPGVWALLVDHEGILWVGTYGGGLDRFDSKTGTFRHFKHQDGDTTSLSDDLVITLCEDRSGVLWVGTAGGLNRFDRTTETFRCFREREGLSNDFVLGILEDNDGRLWISTNKGLSRLDTKTNVFRTYNYEDGLQSDEFSQGAYGKDSKTGEMFFGGPNGLTVFHPADVRDNPYVPPVRFSSFTRYNSDDEEGRPIEEKGISARPEITISYKDNIAYFEFAALSYYNNFKNRYAYKLEGFNDNWIQLGTERRATFTNLDGGEYLLRVRGSNNDGVWNEEGATLKLIVRPPWWKTTWAYTGYGVLIIAFLYGARRFEINQREQKAKMREAQLHAKAIEAEKKVLQAENERKSKELEDARRLQLSMLPTQVPQLPGYEIAVFMKTATEVGGDYYDFSLSNDGTLDVAFGDATGHGMQAGTVVTLMKGLFLLEAARTDIQTFFGNCTRAIKETKLGRMLMAFSLVRIRGNSVSLSTAGMPPVYLHRMQNGSIEEILLKGMPLGAMKNFPYSLHETILGAGDTLLLLTDGLPEQKNPREEMFDYTRVQGVFASVIGREPKEIIEELVKAGETWMDGVAQDDDITLMVIRKTA